MSKKSEAAPASGETKKPASFEEALTQLQEIVRELESGERSLDDSLKLYEQGIASLRACHSLLDQAEQRIRKLVAGSDGKILETPLEPDEYGGETTAIAVEPGAISSGPTQVLPAVSDEALADYEAETKRRKPANSPKRGRTGKDSSLFSE